MNVSLDKKNVRTTGKVYIKGILCGKITIAKLLVTLKKRWEREEKDTIVSKFNNNNFLILSRRSFVLRSFRFDGNNFKSIFHSYVQRKSFYDTFFCYTAIEKTRVFLNVVKIVEQNISRYCMLNAAYDFEILMRNW